MTAEILALVTAGCGRTQADATHRLASDWFKVGILSSVGKGKVPEQSPGDFGVTAANQIISDDGWQQGMNGVLPHAV